MPAADSSMMGIIPNMLKNRQRSAAPSSSGPRHPDSIDHPSEQPATQPPSSSQQISSPQKEKQPPFWLPLHTKWIGISHRSCSEEANQQLSQEMAFLNFIDISPDATYQDFWDDLLKVMSFHETVWKPFEREIYVDIRAVRSGVWRYGKGVDVDGKSWKKVLRWIREEKVVELRVVCRIATLNWTVRAEELED